MRYSDVSCAAQTSMSKSITSSGSRGGEDGSTGRWQRGRLGVLLAEQVVEDEPAQGSNPGRALLICIMPLPHSENLQFVWQIEDPAKMTHTKLALMRRG